MCQRKLMAVTVFTSFFININDDSLGMIMLT
jgi:hypothetical protein